MLNGMQQLAQSLRLPIELLYERMLPAALNRLFGTANASAVSNVGSAWRNGNAQVKSILGSTWLG